jgi:hypothetical protein
MGKRSRPGAFLLQVENFGELRQAITRKARHRDRRNATEFRGIAVTSSPGRRRLPMRCRYAATSLSASAPAWCYRPAGADLARAG